MTRKFEYDIVANGTTDPSSEPLPQRHLIHLKEERIWLYDIENDQKILPNETELIRTTFREEEWFNKWQECCREAQDCCRRNEPYLPRTTNPSTGKLIDDETRDFCPATWDGLSCWPNSPAGQIAQRRCPLHVYFIRYEPHCPGYVSKKCFANGSWFIRNGHEWSNYNGCKPMSDHQQRFTFQLMIHSLSLMIMAPSLIVLQKVQNRARSKRVTILKNLICWLIINGCFWVIKSSAMLGGVFLREEPPHHAPFNRSNTTKQPDQAPQTSLNSTSLSRYSEKDNLLNSHAVMQFISEGAEHIFAEERRTRSLGDHEIPNSERFHIQDGGTTFNDTSLGDSIPPKEKHYNYKDTLEELNPKTEQGLEIADKPRIFFGNIAKRSTRETRTPGWFRPKMVWWVVVLCWLVELGLRVSRAFVMWWMFTGGIYLCSVLHFAPAEPPLFYIRLLMVLTNFFPLTTSLMYILLRTYFEPSPLNLIKVPYHSWLVGDEDYVRHLWKTHLSCWLDQSESQIIEEILDFPNLAFAVLNGLLFVITIFMMCRISRPGSNRPELKLANYAKAAGTLMAFYGCHYIFFLHKPVKRTCLVDQVIFYSYRLVDSFQGVVVAYVFCYRTHEGKDILFKWWRNKVEGWPKIWKLLCCFNRRSHDFGLMSTNNKANLSSRSNNSACNGQETVTELMNVGDNPAVSQF